MKISLTQSWLLLLCFLPSFSNASHSSGSANETSISRGPCSYGSLWCNNTALNEYTFKSCSLTTTEGYPNRFPQLFALKQNHIKMVRINSLPFNFALPPNLAGGSFGSNSRCYPSPFAKSIGVPLMNLASDFFSTGDRKNSDFSAATGFVILDPITTIPGDYRISYDAWEVHEAPNCTYVSGARGISKTIYHGDSITTYLTPTPHPDQGSCSAISRNSKCLYMQGFDRSTYDYENCSEGCTLDGVKLRSGESSAFYSTTNSYNCSADSQLRTCNNGSLSGSSSFSFASCSQRVDCQGSWGACINGTRVFSITRNAANGGASCSHSNGETDSSGCPVDCIGSWGSCNNGSRVFTITRHAANGGASCSYSNGTVDSSACPVDCIGSWGACNNGSRVFSITQNAANGGVACTYANGAIDTSACASNCKWEHTCSFNPYPACAGPLVDAAYNYYYNVWRPGSGGASARFTYYSSSPVSGVSTANWSQPGDACTASRVGEQAIVFVVSCGGAGCGGMRYGWSCTCN